ncbi:MAG: hypothetical protein LBD52_02065 [Prevotellaceae bacterium]|jgi:hypothetical protein|nr:hypothetical protein [Prevotellaceae bacterium]
MNTIVVTPQSEKEYSFLLNFFKEKHIRNRVFTHEDKEDAGLLKMMLDADRTDRVCESEIMSILRQ